MRLGRETQYRHGLGRETVSHRNKPYEDMAIEQSKLAMQRFKSVERSLSAHVADTAKRSASRLNVRYRSKRTRVTAPVMINATGLSLLFFGSCFLCRFGPFVLYNLLTPTITTWSGSDVLVESRGANTIGWERTSPSRASYA